VASQELFQEFFVLSAILDMPAEPLIIGIAPARFVHPAIFLELFRRDRLFLAAIARKKGAQPQARCDEQQDDERDDEGQVKLPVPASGADGTINPRTYPFHAAPLSRNAASQDHQWHLGFFCSAAFQNHLTPMPLFWE
jgi:hypothetical protein